MTDESFAHLPRTATIDVEAVLERLNALTKATSLDLVLIQEAQARVADREREAGSLRMILSMVGGGVLKPEDPVLVGEIVPFPKGRPSGPKLTHKYMALKILADENRGMRTAEILRHVHQRFGKTIDQTSLSPLTAKLRDARLVAHDKDKSEWSVTEAGRTHLAEIEGVGR